MAAIPGDQQVIWVHSVSVGETIAAAPLVKRLQAAYPAHLVAVTTTTPTGSERVQSMLGDSVYHSYAPYDLPDAVNRTLDRLHPQCLIIMETELWPNLIHSCRSRCIPVLLANARLSASSAQGYGRFSYLSGPMLSKLSMVAAQHGDDGKRFIELGLPSEKLVISGNIKFDFSLTDGLRHAATGLADEWCQQGGRLVWLAASTHQGEEEVILAAFAAVRRAGASVLLVLVPRHPDRFERVAKLCSARGFSMVRRSSGLLPTAATDIVLGDTMGELQAMYGACDLAFVGGSLVPVGGHNLLEPAAWEKPVLSGPELFNFSEISKLLLAADALEVCMDAEQLAQAVTNLLRDGDLRVRRGEAAHRVVEANRGAMDRLMSVIEQMMA